MKLLSKIMILAMLAAFVSSCQKEELPQPMNGLPGQGAANQRVSDPTETTDYTDGVIKEEKDVTTDEVVGGGDDDRDGGGKKNEKKSGS